METGDLFTKPAVKLFCKQLKECQQTRSTESWFIPLRNATTTEEVKIPIHTVWLQGTIHSIINKSNIILKDTSGGIVKVTDCEKMAGGCDWIQQGMYCAVVGVLVSSVHTPVIRAIKMNPLDNVNNMQLLWDWEVKDLANFLATQ